MVMYRSILFKNEFDYSTNVVVIYLHKLYAGSPTSTTKRREMVENKTQIHHIGRNMWRQYNTIKRKAREVIQKHKLDEIRETIEAF